jgi:RNA polymerase sigma factor (sigma-70 family)
MEEARDLAVAPRGTFLARLGQLHDRVLVEELQEFASKSSLLHWRNVVSDNPFALLVRFGDETKIVASNSTLFGRYGSLVRRHVVRDTCREISPTNRRASDPGLSDAVDRLRDLALRYDASSRFSGYLNTTLEYRRRDDCKRRRRDPLILADRSGLADLDGSDELEERLSDTSERVGTTSHGSVVSQEDRVTRGIDSSRIVSRVLAALAPRGRNLLALHLEGLTDSQIGARLGLSRETVNRRLGQIRRQAAAFAK